MQATLSSPSSTSTRSNSIAINELSSPLPFISAKVEDDHDVTQQKLSSMNTSIPTVDTFCAHDVSTFAKTPSTITTEQHPTDTNYSEDISNIPGAHHIGGSPSTNNVNDNASSDVDIGRAGSVMYFPGVISLHLHMRASLTD